MRRMFLILAAAFALPVSPLISQETKDATPAPKPQLTAQELEAKFKSMLTNATLAGRWAPIREGKLSEEKEDKYQVVSVGKISGDSWVVNAKVKYNDREFIAPLPIKVQWAGDTPVVIVDNLTMPGGNRSYSARVLFYDDTYSGTWSGGDSGGMLYGLITRASQEKKSE